MPQVNPVLCCLSATLVVCSAVVCNSALAQHPPGMGYVFPCGVESGQTTEVILGGYDWTPDMQIFVHDSRISLEIVGHPGPVIVPEPPYWFSKKARRPPFLLPRETAARVTVPDDVPPGIVTWQAANANGATAIGRFVVTGTPRVTDSGKRSKPQPLPALPVCVAGQIRHIREVDRYSFRCTQSGPVTCAVIARQIGSPLSPVLEIRDQAGQIVSEAADTAGHDTALTFAATADQTYVVSVYDVDFRGNRSFTYQLSILPGPRVVAAIPSIGRRGESRRVEFVGYGIATGRSQLESVHRDVTFSAGDGQDMFDYCLQTDHGDCAPFAMHVSDEPQVPGAGWSAGRSGHAGAGLPASFPKDSRQTATLTVPCGLTGVFSERFADHRYEISGAKGDCGPSMYRANELVLRWTPCWHSTMRKGKS